MSDCENERPVCEVCSGPADGPGDVTVDEDDGGESHVCRKCYIEGLIAGTYNEPE